MIILPTSFSSRKSKNPRGAGTPCISAEFEPCIHIPAALECTMKGSFALWYRVLLGDLKKRE